MPLYNVKFSRKVVVRDGYEETIEANSLEEAQAKAATLADEFNDSCPDGVEEISAPECGDWSVDLVEDAPAGTPAPEA